MFKVGLIGAGLMGRTHAHAWRQTPATLSGVYATQHAAPFAEQWGIRPYESLDALFNDVDVVDICAPTHVHHELVLRAAQAGKHIMCEKPLARTVQQGRAMLEACQQAGVMLLVAHVVRFFPEYALAKTAVERGDIGDVAVVRLTRCSFRPKLTADNWFLDEAKSGGLLLDLMIHDFDYARWIAGEVESVYARQNGDYALAILRHTSGAISNVEGGWAYPAPMFRTALEIAGSDGLIEHPAESAVTNGLYLKQSSGEGTPEVGVPTSPLSEDPYTTEIRHFYAVLAEQVNPLVTAEDAFAALCIATAAAQSARTGRRIRITEVE